MINLRINAKIRVELWEKLTTRQDRLGSALQNGEAKIKIIILKYTKVVNEYA